MRFLATLLACACLVSAASASDQRPNIVLILVEDLGPRIGAFGDTLARTPNIDRLAAEGVRYTRTFTTAGVCAPSRAALITGMHQQSIGAQHMRTTSYGDSEDGPLGTFFTEGPPYLATPPEYVKAFPELLRAAGYYTVNNQKTDYQFGEPFTIWDENGPQAHWKNRPPGTPFFAMYSSNYTHESGMFREGFAHRSYALRNVERNGERLAALPDRTDPARVEVPGFLPDTPEVRQDIAIHYDNIRLMDRHVGRIRDELEQAGLLQNTVLIWSTDHGDGLPRGKRSLYESGIHVPMVIRFPDGHGAGEIDDQLLSFVDLAPTLLALAGADIPAHLHGRDFLATDHTAREYIYAARDRLDELPDRSRAVRDARFKYIRNYDPDRPFFMPLYYRENLASMAELRRLLDSGSLPDPMAGYFSGPRPGEELYDLSEDPHELNNLAGDPAYAVERQRLTRALDHWLSRIEDWSGWPESRMRNERLWPGGEQPLTQPVQFSPQALPDGSQRITLSSGTPGASIGYRIGEDDESARWLLYTAPLVIEPGQQLSARAIRYGYAESPATVFNSAQAR